MPLQPKPPPVIQQIEVIEAFADIKLCLAELHHAIVTSDLALPAYTPACSEDRALARYTMASHIGQLWYQPSTPTRLPGLIASSPSTLQCLMKLNLSKSHFKQLIIGLRQKHPGKGARLAQLLGAADGKRDENVQALLERAGMTAINLSHCYRHYQWLPDTTDSVSWTWSKKAPSIKCYSRDKVCLRRL